MARIESWFNQDLGKPVKVQYLDGNVFSQDNQGNVVGVNLFNGNVPATITGSISANIIRSDGATVPVSGALSGNKASVVLPQAAYAVPGPISIIIKVTSGSDIATLCAVVANVYQAATDAVIDPGTIIPSIQVLIEAIQQSVESIPMDYSALSNIVGEMEKSFNRVDMKPTMNAGKLLSPSTGAVSDYSDSSFMVSDMIDITDYSFVYLIAQMKYANAIYCFYDSSSVYITGITLNSGSTMGTFSDYIQKPSNAKYIRVAWVSTGTLYAIDGMIATGVRDNSVGFQGLKAKLQGVFPFEPFPLNFSVSSKGLDGSGNIVTYSGASVTDYIGCENVCSFKYTGETYFLFKAAAFFDNNHNVVAVYPPTGSSSVQITDAIIEVPAEAKYVVFANYTLQTGHATPTASALVPININYSSSPLYGKKVTVIGDSITESNSTAATNWISWIQQETGCIVQNLGISGTGFYRTPQYVDRISSIDSNTDLIGVAISFNDIGHGMDIGTASDTGETTLCGLAYQFFTALLEAFPATPIICYSQGPWASYHLGGQYASGGTYITNVKTICNRLGIPVYDGLYFNGSALRPWNSDNQDVYFKNETSGQLDDTHPNSIGHKIIARHLQPQFEKEICNIVS